MASPSPAPTELSAPTRRSLRGNVRILVWSHLATLAAGFATIPYLARVLQPNAWGQLLLAQALAAWLLLLIEYAFDLSVTRRLAEARAHGVGANCPSDSSHLARTVADALTAGALLAALALLIWALALLLLPTLRTDWRLAGSALLFALARGLTPLWYFLGVERVGRAVLLDTGARMVGALAVFPLVSQPPDAWLVTSAQAVAALLVMWLLRRQMHVDLPALRQTPRTFAGGVAVLRDGFTLFAARASGALYMQLNTLLLGAIASPTLVAMFGGAERLVRAGVSLLDPATRALVARLSYLQGTDARAAQQLAARLVLTLALLGLTAAAAAAALAPWLIALLLGPGYEAAVPVFRLLVLLLPIIATATAIGIFSAVPRGHDRIVLIGTVSAGITNLLLALPLTRRFGAEGLAGSVVIAESVVAVILGAWYWRQMRQEPTHP